jgi:hypothetical protein
MPKRRREETGSDVHSLPPDPLKTIPPFLEKITATGFTVCDLIVVMREMAKVLKTDVHIGGPCEGSIELMELPFSTWLPKNKTGNYTELRFCSLDKKCKDFMADFFFLCKIQEDDLDGNEIVQTIDDSSETIQSRMKYPKLANMNYEPNQIAELLNKPIHLRLRNNFPSYTWPRWAFGVFEGLVVRRCQTKGASFGI